MCESIGIHGYTFDLPRFEYIQFEDTVHQYKSYSQMYSNQSIQKRLEIGLRLQNYGQ